MDILARDELLDIFKEHIMPKPQRQKNTQSSQDSSNILAKEVKRIKLNREPYSHPVYPVCSHNSSIQRMEVRENQNKRSIEETTINKPKRQKIQWP